MSDRTQELERVNADLRAQMQSRHELEVAQARLAAIVESSDDAIVGKNLDGIVTSWNRGAQHLFGYTPEEMIGQSILKIIPADRVDEEREILSRLRRHERIDHFETIRRAKDGRLLNVSITVSPIHDSTGTIVGASKIARDITLQKRVEKEREILLANERAARSAAEHASRMKDEFLATLSHELRTPLTAILGWAQILRANEALTAEMSQGLEVIERNTRAQVQLIEDLLDMSRIVSGNIRLDVQPIDLTDVIRAAIDSVAPAAEAKGVRLQSVLDPNAACISGDAARLQQVAWNLLTNAIRFTPRGGRVQVFLERIDSHVELSVVDTGEGIAPDFLPHVFDRFRQADSSTTRRHGGLGLGLSIVRHLVELHGGTVRAHSAGLNKGTTFVVSLPLRVIIQHVERSAGAAAARAAGMQAELPSLRGLRVLVVDDEADARELIARILQDAGAEVATAPSADEGIAAFLQHRPDVVLSDIGMPGEDGYSFVRRLRRLSSEDGGDTPAVALTAFARSEDRRLALMSGFQMHIAKPAEPSELVVVVANLAGRVG
ncbi:MAG TPA: ATP-binding protein [Candidatus Limnocylindrales bacterium]|nr:ATP-binding protein [Candidatus Limnocylindrales bacterium]